jgi:hypothetical protein
MCVTVLSGEKRLNKSKRDEFLAKAREAEAIAAQATDAFMRENWLTIALRYRELANGEQQPPGASEPDAAPAD